MIILIGCDCLLSWLLQFFPRFFWPVKTLIRSLKKSALKKTSGTQAAKGFFDALRRLVGRATTRAEKCGKKPLTSGRGYVNLGFNEVLSCVNESEIVHFLLSWFRVVKFTSERSYSLIHRRRRDFFRRCYMKTTI